MLNEKKVGEFLEKGVLHVSIYGNQRRPLEREAGFAVRLMARHHDQDWQRTKRATLFLGESGLTKSLFAAEWLAPAATTFAAKLAGELALYAESSGIEQLATDFNRVGYNVMRGSKSRPAIIPPHTDPEALQGVVAIVGLAGTAEPGSVAPYKSAVTLLACKNLCDAVGIDQVVHGSVAREPRVTLTLAQLGE